MTTQIATVRCRQCGGLLSAELPADGPLRAVVLENLKQVAGDHAREDCAGATFERTVATSEPLA